MRKLAILALIYGAVQIRASFSKFGLMQEQLTKPCHMGPSSTGCAIRVITTRQLSVSAKRKSISRKLEETACRLFVPLWGHSVSEVSPLEPPVLIFFREPPPVERRDR